MAQLTLTVIGDVADVNKKIDAIRTTLQQNPIKIRIDASGADAVTKDLIEYAKWSAKAVAAEAELEKQRSKTAAATARQAEAEARATAQREQTNRAAEQTRQAEQRTQRQIELTNTERQRQITVERQTELQHARTGTEAARLATEEQRTETQTARLATEQVRLERAMLNAGNRANFLGQMLRRIEMRAINSAINAVTNSLRDALNTMKAVDDELVTIRKVTGFSGEQIQTIKDQAYQVASAYGETADAYLESVAAFSRAGYKEQSSALAELATKTQIVGDTTAETANQFLLSVDKAYKYQGSIEALTKVLDGANELDNKYATSIEKIASGMGIVAPVAAQMHVSVDELAASIGTITAVTQRSGTEAARALRALFLNIAGDTKTEIDEGVTWTTGEIEGLREVVRLYAKDAYDAAQATGEIIDPMKAMEGLAKSMQDGILTEQKLMEMVSDIGGKLRTSQLLAIIQNWDMYQSMLQDYAGAIGSADREVENALDSWTRKTNILKNEWAEFMDGLISTETIKTGLDGLIAVVDGLDSAAGRLVVTIGAIGVALTIAFTNPVGLAIEAASVLILTVGALAAKHKEHEAALRKEYAELYNLKDAVDDVNDALKKATETEQKAVGAAEASAARANLYVDMLGEVTEGSDEYRAILQNLVEIIPEVSQYIDEESGTLNVQSGELRTVIEDWKNLAIQQAAAAHYTELYTKKIELLSARKSAWEDYNRAQKELIALESEFQAKEANGEIILRDDARVLVDARNAVKGYEDALFAADMALTGINAEISEYDDTVKELATSTGKGTQATKDDTKAKDDNAAATENAVQANETLKKAFEEVDKKSGLTFETLAELDKLYPGLTKKITTANGNLTEEGKAVLESKNAFVELVAQETIFNNSTLDVSGKIQALGELAAAAGVAGNMLAALSNPQEAENAIQYAMSMGLSREAAEKSVLSGYQQRFIKTLAIGDYIGGGDGNSGGGGGGGGGSAKTEEEKEKERQQEKLKGYKQEVADEKAKYELMVAQGASAEELAAQATVVQEKLHQQAEYMREIGSEYSDVAAISKEWFTWEEKKTKLAEDEAKAAEKAAEEEQKRLEDAQKAELQSYKDKVDHWKQELSFLEASGASDEERIAAMKAIQNALHEQADYLRTIEGESDNVRTLSTEWWTYQNKIQDVLDKTAETLKKEIKETVEDIIGQLQEQSDAEIAALQAEIDLLKEQHDVAEDTREEEEKRLAVEQARIALENAQRERTVRQYNAATGQWEWVANAKNVQAAQEELAKSEAALNAYLAEQDYKKKIAELEAQKEESKSLFETVKDAMNNFADAVAKILESPKLDANAKKKFVDDIKTILTAPYFDEAIRADFIQGVTDILTAPDLDEKVKTDFIADIKDVLTAPELSDKAKTQFITSITNILKAPTLDAKVKSAFVSNITSILTSPTLPAKTKEKFISDITNILTAPTLSEKAKQTIIDNLAALINNKSISTEVKTKVADALSALIGTGEGAESAVGTFGKYIENALKTKNPETAIGQLYDAIMSGVVDLNDIGTILAALNGEYAAISTDAAKMLALSKMQANSIAWHLTEDQATKNALHDENVALGNKLGLTYNSAKGTWNDANGNQVYTLSNVGGNWLSELNEKIAYVQDLINNAGSGSSGSTSSTKTPTKTVPSSFQTGSTTSAKTYRSGGAGTVDKMKDQGKTNSEIMSALIKSGVPSAQVAQWIATSTFDSGGILHGMGGIKATTEDEMVLPPDMTRRLLSAEADGAFDALLGHLGIVTAAANRIAGFGGSVSRSSIGSQHNGDVYQIGGVTLTEQQARGMTVYELAQMGRALALHTGS